MGWFIESQPGHKGFLVAYVPRDDDSALWREVAHPERYEGEVRRLAVGCDCGWRSPQFAAPDGTRWAPSSVWLPSRDEHRYDELARVLWHRHMSECVDVRMGPASLRELVAAVTRPAATQPYRIVLPDV